MKFKKILSACSVSALALLLAFTMPARAGKIIEPP